MTERKVWTGGDRPPPFKRPPDGKPLDPGTALGLILDSIPTAWAPALPEELRTPPPLTEEEVAALSAYLDERGGPAARKEPL